MVSFLADTKAVKRVCQATPGLSRVAKLNIAKDQYEECSQKVQRIKKKLNPIDEELCKLWGGKNNKRTLARRLKLTKNKQELQDKLHLAETKLESAAQEVLRAKESLAQFQHGKERNKKEDNQAAVSPPTKPMTSASSKPQVLSLASPVDKTQNSRLFTNPRPMSKQSSCKLSTKPEKKPQKQSSGLLSTALEGPPSLELLSGNAVAGMGVAVTHPGDSHFSLFSRITNVHSPQEGCDSSVHTLNTAGETVSTAKTTTEEEDDEVKELRKRKLEAELRMAELQVRLKELEFQERSMRLSESRGLSLDGSSSHSGFHDPSRQLSELDVSFSGLSLDMSSHSGLHQCSRLFSELSLDGATSDGATPPASARPSLFVTQSSLVDKSHKGHDRLQLDEISV